MFISSKLAAAAVSIALLTTAGAASAREFQSNGRTSEVYHGDLNLTKAADQAELRARIVRASGRVCSSTDLSEQRACRALAVAHVEAPIGAAIARAATGERYADAGREGRAVAGN